LDKRNKNAHEILLGLHKNGDYLIMGFHSSTLISWGGMLLIPSESACSTFCTNKFNTQSFFHNSVSNEGSHEPTDASVRSKSFHSLLFIFLDNATDILLPLSSFL
jgi:hypothetical protein